MDIAQVAAYAFGAVVILITFSFAGYQERKRADIERALIENGKADDVIELRRQRAEHAGAWGVWLSDPRMLFAFGVASGLSAGVIRLAGFGPTYGHADVWFLVLGIFLVAAGVALALARRGRRSP